MREKYCDRNVITISYKRTEFEIVLDNGVKNLMYQMCVSDKNIDKNGKDLQSNRLNATTPKFF